jgi:hypothetical protein
MEKKQGECIMKVTLSGFDDFKKHIDKLQENVKKLEGQHNIPFDELFPASFMSKYTDSSSIEELIQKGNFDIKSQEDFEKIPDDKMNSFIEMHTSFLTWNQMITNASEEWSIRQLDI